MTNVCPIARVPTTITCCRINERLAPVRNLSVWVEKKMLASTSAAKRTHDRRPPEHVQNARTTLSDLTYNCAHK